MIAAILSLWRWLAGLMMPVLIALLIIVGSGLFFSVKWAGAVHARKAAERAAATAQAEASSLKTQLDVCNANVDVLTESLERQNAAVDHLVEESAERSRRATAAVRRAQEQARGLQARITRLQAAKPSGEQCEAARDLIVTTVAEDRR